MKQFFLIGLGLGFLIVTGCGSPPAKPLTNVEKAEIEAELAKLSPEDRALVEAQEWCVISTDERLGSMGPPVKLTLKGTTVFLCCNNCAKRALADPDGALRKLTEMKAKVQQGS